MTPKVLILDDSEIAVALYRTVLEGAGMEVGAATSLFEFEDLVREGPPSLILCDVMMPELLGDSVVQVLRKQYGLQQTPIILLSALPSVELARLVDRSGANGFIHKDTPLDDLVQSVLSYVGGPPPHPFAAA